MSGTTGTIPLQPWVDDQLITKEILNGENSNIASLMDANGCGGHSDTDADAQIQTNPYPGSVLSKAASIAGELERLRYAIAQITGKTYWYQPAANGNNLGSVFLTGEIRALASSTVPTGFLACDGSAISRTTYASLFSSIGTTWGVGDGSTTFNVPDGRGKTLLGAGTGSGLTARSVGQTGGEETHILSLAESPAHDHNYADPGHIHAATDSGHTHGEQYGTLGGATPSFGTSGNFNTAGVNGAGITTAVGTANISVNSHTTGITHNSQGGGTAHNNMQPWACVNYVIKT